MWEFWKDKKGIVEAIEQQYPELLKSNLQVMMHVALIKSHLHMLDHLMKSIDGETCDA